GVAEMNRASADALAALQEAARHLEASEAATRDLARERAQLRDSIATCQRDIAGPRRERIDLVFEFGTPRPDDGHVDFGAIRTGTSGRNSENARVSDPGVWRRPRLVRVWGKNTSLCQSIAEQRFGTRREFQLVELDEQRRAALGL